MKQSAVGEAPGRLDFMGGVADYSGSLVLQMPIRGTTRVSLSAVRGDRLRFASRGHGAWSAPLEPFRVLLDSAADETSARGFLQERGAPPWAFYLLGCLWVFCRAKSWRPTSGLSFDVQSRVPEGMGVASSAALEVATLRALGRLTGARFEGAELARLGQQAENRIVGAPCGLMDQLAAGHGRTGSLLPILCRPDILRRPVPLPPGVAVVGWASGVQHAVAASPYATARTATFMGKRIFEEKTERSWKHAAEIAPSYFHDRAPSVLPKSIGGRWFTRRYRKTEDPLAKVSASQTYNVRSALRFPIEENFRCELAESLLRGSEGRLEDRLRQVGELMLQSHAGYKSLGLGAAETDQMVDALKALGPGQGIYGGRSSGGGSGGTVVVLLKKSARGKLAKLAKEVKFNDRPTSLISVTYSREKRSRIG